MICIKKVGFSIFDREPLKAIEGITTSLSETAAFRKPFMYPPKLKHTKVEKI